MFGFNQTSITERRLRSLEHRLERLGNATVKASTSGASTFMSAADRAADALASVFGDTAERLRGGARTVGDEAYRVRDEAARIGGDVAVRLSREVAERPLVILAVAVGVGVLIGIAGRRR